MNTVATLKVKTNWQKIYSFFGFWSYILYTENGKRYRAWYWNLFPFWFIRKFDFLKIESNK